MSILRRLSRKGLTERGTLRQEGHSPAGLLLLEPASCGPPGDSSVTRGMFVPLRAAFRPAGRPVGRLLLLLSPTPSTRGSRGLRAARDAGGNALPEGMPGAGT